MFIKVWMGMKHWFSRLAIEQGNQYAIAFPQGALFPEFNNLIEVNL
jgi:hypothetical protein